MVPIWITPSQVYDLNPPAEVRALGDLPRTPEKLLSAAASLHVTQASRYAPSPVATWCNRFLADVLKILRAPIESGITANAIVAKLRAGAWPGWFKVVPVPGVSVLAYVAHRAAAGAVTIVTYENPNPAGHGHVALVVPPPPNSATIYNPAGVWVTAAGRVCRDQCPLRAQFGDLPVEFWGFQDPPLPAIVSGQKGPQP